MSRFGLSDQKYKRWTERSKIKLKATIKDNDNKRREKATEIIRKFLLESFPDSNVNVSLFKIIQSDTVLQEYYAEVDKWEGVDLNSIKDKDTTIRTWTFKEYHQKADNWWNRYKAKWLGNKIYYPLFKTEIDQFIKHNGCHSCARAARSKSKTNKKSPDYNSELLKAMIMKEVMKTPKLHGKVQYQVSFPRSRPQPMILGQSYSKAPLLMELLREFGGQYEVEYPIHDKTKDVAPKVHAWIDEVIEKLREKGDIENIIWNECDHDEEKEDEQSLSLEPTMSESSNYARAREFFIDNNYQSEQFRAANQNLLESPNYSFGNNIYYTPPSPSPSSISAPSSPSQSPASSPMYCICSHPPTKCDKCGGLCHPMLHNKRKQNQFNQNQPRASFVNKDHQPNYRPNKPIPRAIHQHAPEPFRFIDPMSMNHLAIPPPPSEHSSEGTMSQWSINETCSVSKPIHPNQNQNGIPPPLYHHDRYSPYNRYHRASVPIPVQRYRTKCPPMTIPKTHSYARSTSTHYRDAYRHNYHDTRSVQIPVPITPPIRCQMPNFANPPDVNQFNPLYNEDFNDQMPGGVDEELSGIMGTNTSSNMSVPPMGPSFLTSFNSQENNFIFPNMNDDNCSTFHS